MIGRALRYHRQVMSRGNEPEAVRERLLERAAHHLAWRDAVEKLGRPSTAEEALALAEYADERHAAHRAALAPLITHETKLSPEGEILEMPRRSM